jgi:formimidoylglutamate deiminase
VSTLDHDERGWLPDCIVTGGNVLSGLALFADEQGRIARLSRNPEDLSRATRLPGRAILPGLVNGHSHTFQRVIRGRTEFRSTAGRDTFWTWREKMYRAATLLSPEEIYIAARMAFLEMALSGITTVAEFHYLHHQADGSRYADPNLLSKEVIRAARETGLRIGLLRTAYVRAGFQKEPNPGQTRFITANADQFVNDTEALCSWSDQHYQSDEVVVGIAPHSLRAVPIDYLREVARYALGSNLVIHMHVAEQPAEVEACYAEYGATPVALLQGEGILRDGFTAIHAIHITEKEAQLLGDSRSIVCACPTSERNLGDGAVPADKLLRAKTRISLGSDSQIQIDLLEDARLLEYHLRMEQLQRVVLAPTESALDQDDTLTKRLLYAATRSGAESLRMPVGDLVEGAPADFFTLDLSDPSIAGASSDAFLTNVLFSVERSAVRDVFVGGHSIVTDGRHPHQESIVAVFRNTQATFWKDTR